jgi:hypothetical protein
MGNMVTSNGSLTILMDLSMGGNFAVMASLDVMMLVAMAVFFAMMKAIVGFTKLC